MEEKNIDERIERGIRSLASKKKDIECWEREETFRKHRNRKIRFFCVGGAASVAVICTIVLGFYNSVVYETRDRGDSSFSYQLQPSKKSSDPMAIDEEVKSLMEIREYELALEVIETYMIENVCDSSLSAEKKFSEDTAQFDKEYDLEWMKIQCLLGLKRMSEAEELLKSYIQRDSGIHLQDAKKQFENLNRQRSQNGKVD